MPSQFASPRQFRMQMPAVQALVHVLLSLQSNEQKFEVQVALHLAVSSHSIVHGPRSQARLHVLSPSHAM
jgi:hypothetical protein